MFDLIFKSSVSLSFELNNKDIYFAKEKYNVFVNGEKTLTNVNTNVFSLFNLTPNTTYVIEVNSHKLEITTDSVTSTVNVLDFNAKPDGITDTTFALQAAINTAPSGSLIIIPEGTYYTRPLFLRSDLTIELKKG